MEHVPFHNQTLDMRFAVMDSKHKTAKVIRRIAKRDSKFRVSSALRSVFETLDMSTLNHLAVAYMIDSRWNGATGEGGVWAAASELCNMTAREVLRTRPMFEAVED